MWVVGQRTAREREQSFLSKIAPQRAVGSVSTLQRYPQDGNNWEEVIHASKRQNAARTAMVRDDYRITDWALESYSIASSYVGKQIFR
jgi:hypothetical protein